MLVLDPPNRTPYTCAICKLPGTGTPNQKTHPGACAREWRRQKDAAKREQKLRDAARLMAGRTVL